MRTSQDCAGHSAHATWLTRATAPPARIGWLIVGQHALPTKGICAESAARLPLPLAPAPCFHWPLGIGFARIVDQLCGSRRLWFYKPLGQGPSATESCGKVTGNARCDANFH